MTLGELADKLAALRDAEQEVEAAELSLRHGGNEATVRGKQWHLETCVRYVEILRSEDIKLIEESHD